MKKFEIMKEKLSWKHFPENLKNEKISKLIYI